MFHMNFAKDYIESNRTALACAIALPHTATGRAVQLLPVSLLRPYSYCPCRTTAARAAQLLLPDSHEPVPGWYR